jgi:hypothetical protein
VWVRYSFSTHGLWSKVQRQARGKAIGVAALVAGITVGVPDLAVGHVRLMGHTSGLLAIERGGDVTEIVAPAPSPDHKLAEALVAQ